MKNTRAIFFLQIFSILLPLSGQVIPFDNYYVRDGLPSNSINDIEQDAQGYLWLATQEGVAKFDGYTFQTYKTRDGLPDNNVYDIFIDSKERIWFATESGGLAVLQNNSFRKINQSTGLVSDYSNTVFEDKSGNIWYISLEGFSIITPDTILNFNAYNSEVVGEIHASYVALDSSVWFSTFDKVFRYKDSLEVVKKEILNGVVVRAITEDRKGSFWFGTQEKGVIHISGSQALAFNSSGDLGSDYVFAVTPLNAGEVLVGTSFPGGVFRIRNDRITESWTEDLENIIIWDILKDKRGRFWAKTHENGVLLITRNSYGIINNSNNLCDNKPYKIFEDRNGNLWICTEKGLSKYGKILFEIYNQNLINSDNKIQCIAENNDEIYVGTKSGLTVLRGEKAYYPLEKQAGLSDLPDVLSIYPLNGQEVWLGTYNGLTQIKNHRAIFYPDSAFYSKEDFPTCATDLEYIDDALYSASELGLVKYYRKKYTLYNKADGLPDDRVWSVKADKDKNLWCATQNGLSVYDGQAFHNFDTSFGLPDNYCNDIAFNNQGIGYVATQNGLAEITLHDDWTIACRNYSKEDGLGSEALLLVIVDKNNTIWVGHNKGIDRIDTKTGQISGYGSLEGFLPNETFLGAATLSHGNDIWFGTLDGVVRYIPDNDVTDLTPPEVHITSVTLFGDSSLVSDFADSIDQGTLLPMGLKLKYNKNNLLFGFVGIHYTIIEKNQYRYMLEGFDDYWLDPVKETEALYRRIPPGKYRFKVLASNCDGVWSTEAAVFPFEIRPPFWATWWFHALEAILAIGVIILIIRYRERKLRHDREVLAQKVKERTIEIARQRDQIALQKQEITDSILYAERIQSAVLPNKEYIDKWLNDYFILFKPRDIVSGDYYWVNGNQDRVMVVAADCTGHGVPGAFMSMLGVSILNEVATESRDFEAGEILDLLRDHLTSTLWQRGGEKDAKDGMDMVLCIFDFGKMHLQFAAAYNPLVIVRDGEIIVHKADRMPVGYHPEEMQPFQTQHIHLQKEDRIYMFSDGYADQFGGPHSKKFKSVPFRDLLLEISQLPMGEQKERLNETIIDWMGINEQVDDILVMGIRV